MKHETFTVLLGITKSKILYKDDLEIVGLFPCFIFALQGIIIVGRILYPPHQCSSESAVFSFSSSTPNCFDVFSIPANTKTQIKNSANNKILESIS